MGFDSRILVNAGDEGTAADYWMRQALITTGMTAAA